MFIFAASCEVEEINIQPGNDVVGIMTTVSDVDTFYVEGEPIRVRLWGVDGPECPHPCNDAGALYLREHFVGELMRCAWVDHARTWERKVVRCDLPDGRDLGQVLLDEGLVVGNCKFAKGVYGCPE